jgi:hypothetical protein
MAAGHAVGAGLDVKVVRWSDWSGTGHEHLVLDVGRDSITADSVVLGRERAGPFAARYRLTCDPLWRILQVTVELIGSARRLDLSSDGLGHWLDTMGTPLADLDGAVDIDLSISPFTNTLPIRRLDLEAGQSADIVTAYIHVPELTVTPDPQRYTCLQRRQRYRYESRDSEFVRDIETDPDGLVLSYPGLFRRIP